MTKEAKELAKKVLFNHWRDDHSDSGLPVHPVLLLENLQRQQHCNSPNSLFNRSSGSTNGIQPDWMGEIGARLLCIEQ
jgi:hypothetical protein